MLFSITFFKHLLNKLKVSVCIVFPCMWEIVWSKNCLELGLLYLKRANIMEIAWHHVFQ